jgi:uncharacterized protein (TIGR03084 family)
LSHPGWKGDPILDDLAGETESLLGMVDGLDDAELDRMTPAEPWTIRDQLSHLAGFDIKALTAATDPERFMAEMAEDFADGGDALMHRQFAEGRAMTAKGVLDWLRKERSALIGAFSRLDPEERIPWYGPPMKTRASAEARLMETWAHGVDVADTLGVVRQPTDRLFHVAELGVKTFRFSFQNRGLEVPEDRVRVTLSGPSGSERVWNEDSSDSISGPVEDFCLVVAQRRHPADTRLEVSGPTAAAWITHAQVFAGPPGPGRPPRTQG